MFFGCESLEAVDVTSFDTHNVTNMDQMFGDCASFTSLDLSGFDTGNVSKMSFMFRYCPKLQRIYVSDKWDVSGVTSSSSMFSDCPELPNYDASYHDKTKAYYGGDGLGYLTYRPYTNNSGSGSQGASGNDQEPPEDENTGTYFTGTITPFQADGSGNASPSFLNASDDTTTFDGLPEGASYVITETACGYKPSYAVYKNEEKTEQRDGKKDEALSTEKGEFSLEGNQNDYVEYVNTKNSFNLEVGKTTIGDTNKKFDFTINLSGLHEEEYTARISGNKTAGISMNADGDITVTVVTGSAEGLPVKLIRPYDGNSKTLYTDAQGKISADKFVSWLSKGQKKAYDFTVQWNGGETTGRFMIPE
jgi:surface protein